MTTFIMRTYPPQEMLKAPKGKYRLNFFIVMHKINEGIKNRYLKILRTAMANNGKGARNINHRVANLCLVDRTFKNPQFCYLQSLLLKFSLICFSHFSAPIKTNLISGWTSPLSTENTV